MLWTRLNVEERIQIDYKKECLTLDDGGTVSVHWAGKPDKGVIVLFPGLGANADFGYVKNCVRQLVDEGFEVAVLHFRGVHDM